MSLGRNLHPGNDEEKLGSYVNLIVRERSEERVREEGRGERPREKKETVIKGERRGWEAEGKGKGQVAEPRQRSSENEVS